MISNGMKILLVDDEEDIIEFLSYNLEKENYIIDKARDGNEALIKAETFMPDLIILDIMMPGLDGIEVCSTLREDSKFDNTLIVFLTARNESFTQITALENGGDDFINKPIKPKVLKSRIQAVLRRHVKNQMARSEGNVYRYGDLEINADEFTAYVSGKKILLAKKEFELLTMLTSKPGKVFKRDEILSQVWGREVIVGDRTIDVHVRKLREKIGSKYIQTLKGIGYKFEY